MSKSFTVIETLKLSSDSIQQRIDDRFWLWIATVALLGTLLRIGLIAANYSSLTDDRDAYLTLAESLAKTGQYGVGEPTAFRPPLYPIVLAAAFLAEGVIGVSVELQVAGINLFAAAATIVLAGWIGKRCGRSPVGLTTAILVAVSPLGCRYVTLPMTETLCMALLTAATAITLRMLDEPGMKAAVSLGLLVGLAAMCRPTAWLPGIAYLAVIISRRNTRSSELAAIVLAAAACLVPWMARNAQVFGKPVALTTHGGYTIALGNNDAFYDDVVRQPWGTVWTTGQQEWIAAEQAAQAEAEVRGELQSDAAYRATAKRTIRKRPADFLRACWLRFLRFWWPVPLTDFGPWILRVGSVVFYVSCYAAALFGLFRAIWVGRRWIPVLAAAPVLFCVLHLVYWSNARMRLPIEPSLFVFSAFGFVREARKPFRKLKK